MRNWAVGLLLCVCLAPRAFGWGDDGHKAINRVAAGRIPASMPAFLQKAGARLEYLGPEPDRWRGPQEFALKEAQEPDHFINLERLADLPELPPGRYEFYRLLYEKRAALARQQKADGGPATGTLEPDDFLPERVGLQPYIVMEVYGRLKTAFREYRYLKAAGQNTEAVEQNIVFYMGWLGHYVGDAANPLHTTVQYNGWIGPNPHGYTTGHQIHWQMETQFVTANLAQLQFGDLVKAPVRLDDPWPAYLAYLRHSHTLVERCYELEKAGGFIGAGTAEARQFIRHRLAAGAQMLVNLWYTAWMESDVPPAATPRN